MTQTEAKQRLPISRALHRVLRRVLERAIDPARGYPLPAGSRLERGRLETLLDRVEAARPVQRSRVLMLSRREAATLDHLLSWVMDSDVKVPGSAQGAQRRAEELWTRP